MIESMAQVAAAAFLGRPLQEDESMKLVSVRHARFVAHPGDKLSIVAEIIREKLGIGLFRCSILTEGELVADAEIEPNRLIDNQTSPTPQANLHCLFDMQRGVDKLLTSMELIWL